MIAPQDPARACRRGTHLKRILDDIDGRRGPPRYPSLELVFLVLRQVVRRTIVIVLAMRDVRLYSLGLFADHLWLLVALGGPSVVSERKACLSWCRCVSLDPGSVWASVGGRTLARHTIVDHSLPYIPCLGSFMDGLAGGDPIFPQSSHDGDSTGAGRSARSTAGTRQSETR